MSLSRSPINTNLADIFDEKQAAKVPVKPAHNYGSLDKSLVAVIRRVTKDGKAIHDSEEVYAILTEGDLELASQYSSPFENSNPEQRYPTLSGMLQSGDMVDSIGRIAGGPNGVMTAMADVTKAGGALAIPMAGAMAAVGAVVGLGEDLRSLEGRSAFTKVNSTQIYTSTQPVRLSCTLFFRAWRNAKTEVENQVHLLQEWVLPAELSKTGALENLFNPNQKGILNSLFPSTMPPFVSLTYGGKKYTPMLLESVNTPIVVERDQQGNRLALTVQCAFVSRTSWDKNDLRKL